MERFSVGDVGQVARFDRVRGHHRVSALIDQVTDRGDGLQAVHLRGVGWFASNDVTRVTGVFAMAAGGAGR